MDEVPKERPTRNFRPRQRPNGWSYGYVPRQPSHYVSSGMNNPKTPPKTNISSHPTQNTHQKPSLLDQLPQPHKKTTHKFKLRNFRLPKRTPKSSKKKLLFVPVFFMLILIISIIGTTFIGNPSRVEAAIGIRATLEGTAGNDVTTKAFTVPSGMKEGDIMIAVISISANVTFTQASWTSVTSCVNTGKTQIFWKQASASDASSPGSYTWTWGGSTRNISGGITAYSGVTRTSPPTGTVGTCSTGTSATASAGGITSTSGRQVLAAFGQTDSNSSGQTLTEQSPLNHRIRGTSTDSSCTFCTPVNAAYALGDIVSSGNTSAMTATSTQSATWVGVQFELVPNTDPTLEQSAYRWYTNANSVTPGAALAANNTAITAFGLGDIARLRVLMHVSGSEMLIAVDTFKLRFAVQQSGSCTTANTPANTYSDVSTSSGAIQFYNNATPNDGDNIATLGGANDPSHGGGGGDTIIAQTYEEANNFQTRAITAIGQDAMWDFAITNVSAPANTVYCFRVTKSDGNDINTYTQFPQLTSRNVSYEASAYRWFNNADSTTPGTTLAAQDTAITQVNTSANFRLRMLIHNGGSDAIPIAYESFKLQFAVQSGGSCSATPTGSYGDVATGSGAIRYLNNATPADNATAVTDANDPTHSGHTKVMQYYKEANNFTTRLSQPAGQDGLWDFALTNNSAPFGTVYCFRAIKAADSSTITNTVYPQITIVNPAFEQAAYRWYDNNNGTTPGTVRAANNTVTTGIAQTAQFRLRMLVHISSDSIFTGTETFKLQFASKTGGSCGDDETFGDVATGSGAVRYFDNAAPADAAATSTTGSDPSHSGHTIRAQTYEESNNFTSNTTTAVGEDALWDFSLATSSAPLRTSYCFKIVRSSGSDINTYTVYPELTTIDPRYDQSAYRWLNNADNITPGSAYAANNTLATDVSQNTVLRLRMLMHVSNDASGVGLDSFKLRFSPKVGTCDVAGVGETYADLASGSGEFRYNNNASVADPTNIAATGGDPSHGADTIVTQTYKESNNFATIANTPVGQDAMWDFAIINFSASQFTSWCFRVEAASGSPTLTYSQIAEIATAPSLLNQSAYRWFQNVNIADMLTITNNPTPAALDGINDTALDVSGGYIYLVGHENNQWRIEKRKAADAELCSAAECGTQFGTNGVVTDNLTGTAEQPVAIAIDTANDRMYVVGFSTPSAGNEEWHIQKRKLSDGTLDTGFDGDGRMTPTVTVGHDRIEDIVTDSTYMYLVGWDTGEGQRIRLEKRALSDGALDTGFDPDAGLNSDPQDTRLDGIYAINPSADSRDDRGSTIAVDSTYVYLVGWDENPGNDNAEWRIEKMNKTTGVHDDGFDTDGVVIYDFNNFTDHTYGIAIDSTNMYVVGDYEPNNGNRGWMMQKRSLTSGALDTAFDGETGETGDGILHITLSGNHDDAYDIVLDSTYLYVAGHDASGTDKGWRTEKRKQSNGKLCTAAECGTAFDTDGIIYTDPSGTLDDEALNIVIDTTNSRIYIAGYDQTPASADTQWRIEKRKSTDGSRGWEPPNALVAQDTKTTLTSGVKFRLRITAHVSGENMAINAETLKLQIAQKIGTCDSGFVGETYADVGTSGGDISYYDNSNMADASTSVSIEGDPSHSGHTTIVETYEEANNFTFPTGVNAGQDALWDIALIDNSAFGNYCFRIVKSDNNILGAYNVVPEIVFCDRPKTENLLRHGNFFCDDSKKKFYWN